MDPAIVIASLAMLGATTTAYFGYKATTRTTDATNKSTSVAADKVESEGWASLLEAHRLQLDRIHQDYQAEIRALVARFEIEIEQVEKRATRAEETVRKSETALREARQAIETLKAQVRSLEQTRKKDHEDI
jgi:chromosome segregation ATPase